MPLRAGRLVVLAQLALYPHDKGWHPKEPTLVAGGPFCVLFSSQEHRALKGRDPGYILFPGSPPFLAGHWQGSVLWTGCHLRPPGAG